MGTNEYAYVYDPIGNRTAATNDGVAAAYAANALNQYTNLQSTAYSLQPSYDLDGNMLTNGPWAYTWDAENRMASACSNNVLLVTNVYDHLSRRIRKEVYVWDSQAQAYSLQSTASFLYDGWNPVREIHHSSIPTFHCVTNYYTWGLDLAEQSGAGLPRHSAPGATAGGVGGLLAVTTVNAEPGTSPTLSTYYPAYDANGNIVQYFDTNGVAVASFEYDAFGNTVSTLSNLSTSELSNFPYRFSTKYFDPETGLYYYGFRYYHPELGRWVSRDPIGERQIPNLYSCVRNSLVCDIDFLGLTAVRRKRTILEYWTDIIYETEETSFVPGQPPADLHGLSDADPGIAFNCTCVNRDSTGGDVACVLTMSPSIRFPSGYQEMRDHELRHVTVFENVYLASYLNLLSYYISSGKCCNCGERAAQLNKYGAALLTKLMRWERQKEYFSKDDGQAEPAIDYGAAVGPLYDVVQMVLSEGVLPCSAGTK